MLGVYIHIPFCQQKCKYCAFSSFVTDEKEKDRYVEKLITDIKEFHSKYPKQKYKNIDTVYLGGGTPSVMSINHIEKIISAIRENFILSDDYEFTIECNPNSLTEEKLKFYKLNGINRISIGLQSLDNEELKFVGRLHDRDEAINEIKNAKKYFDNISCDLLIGIKGMEKGKFLKQLEILSSLEVKHISTYMLQVEKGTPLEKMVKNREVLLPDDDQCVDIYEETAKFLGEKGFLRYEVSNFAIKGFESRHNLKYWSGEEYVGFGLSAHSFLANKRIACAETFQQYYQNAEKFCENLSDKDLIEEHIMLGLRCKLGIDKNYLLKKGYDIDKNQSLKEFIDKGIIIFENERLFLKPDYYAVNNYIITSLLPD